MATSRLESAAHVVITIVVGAIGGAVGFRHTHDWAVANGQQGWIAWAVAVVIECMVIVAGLELKRRRGPLPLFVLVAAFLMQMAAQVASAPKTPAGWLIAATPALGFLVIVKLLLRRLSDPVVAPVDQAPGVHVPVEPVAAPVAATALREDHPLPRVDPLPVDHHEVREIEPAPVPEPPASTPVEPSPVQSPAPTVAYPAVTTWPPASN